MAILQLLDLSTAHINPAVTPSYLNDHELVAVTGGGWLVPVCMPPEEDLPPDLGSILTHAKDHGCDWIMLDMDADTVAGLKTFDW